MLTKRLFIVLWRRARTCVRVVVRRSRRAFTSCLGGFFSSARRPVLDGVSLRSPVRYFPDCLSRARLPRRPTAFLTAESHTTVGRVHRGGSDPLTSPLSRRRESTFNQSRQSVVYGPFHTRKLRRRNSRNFGTFQV